MIPEEFRHGSSFHYSLSCGMSWLLDLISDQNGDAFHETVEKVASKMGVETDELGGWITGDTLPDLHELDEFAKATGWRVDWLLGRADNELDTELFSASLGVEK